MGYEQLDILRSYKTNKNDVVREFYVPILTKSVLYKRAVGFFSSTALIELSQGISGLIKNGGKIKFIVSPMLSEEDIEAIQKGYNEREIINRSLEREIKEPKTPFEEERLNWLAHLIASNCMEIKVAFTPPNKKTGIYHEKIGLLYDDNHNRIGFTGSMNETINAFHNNYESIVVFNSLVPEDEKRVDDLERDFDLLWEGQERNVIVVEFPRILKEKLVSYKKDTYDLSVDEKELQVLYESQQIAVGVPVIPKGVKLHPYQDDAISKWAENNYRGIFDMATGTGKTYTGLGACARLFKDTGKAAIIIVCPYQHLVEQWVEDIEKFNMRPSIGYSASTQRDWKTRLADDIIDFNLGVIDTFCFVTTNATFSSKYVQEQMNNLGRNTLLLVDEAHNFGSPKLSQLLNPRFQYRLALSATLDRYGDPDGTQALYDYFGEKCINYGLDRAIREDKLTPYYYYPIPVYFNDEELEKYKALSYEIAKECYKDKFGKLKITKKGERKTLERARLIAGISSKLSELRKQIEPFRSDSHILVYCGATKMDVFDNDTSEKDEDGERQIVCVSKMLGNELGMKVTHFTSNESAKEREFIKKAFSNVEPYQALIAIKCLDEGVNIPSIKTAFILASTTNPKEYIQRRGRVLRKAENKPYAVIYDFVTLARPLDEVDQYSSSFNCERTLAKRELLRIKEFGRIALNSREADALINDITDAYNISEFDLENIDDGTEIES